MVPALDSGTPSLTSWDALDLDLLLSKTSLAERGGGCPRCGEICICLDTEAAPSHLLPPKSERLTSGSESSSSPLWPTPRAERAGRSVKLYRGTVSGASHARQANGGHGDLEEEVARRDPKAASIGGPLNPAWIEWLMGFPDQWTDVRAGFEPLVTRSSRSAPK
jgi:hypothetical protein